MATEDCLGKRTTAYFVHTAFETRTSLNSIKPGSQARGSELELAQTLACHVFVLGGVCLFPAPALDAIGKQDPLVVMQTSVTRG